MTAALHSIAYATDRDSPAQLPASIRVVLADDHAMVRRTLRLLLEGEEDVDVIAEAVDLSALMRHVSRHIPHVLVLDLRLPNGSSIEMIRQLRKQFPETEVVVLTMEESPLFARAAIDAGATGFVLKDRADTELVSAVRLAAGGAPYVSPRVASALQALRRAGEDDGPTPRESDIVRMIALGHTSAEIACRLHLSRRTSRLIARGSTTSSGSRLGRSSCSSRCGAVSSGREPRSRSVVHRNRGRGSMCNESAEQR